MIWRPGLIHRPDRTTRLTDPNQTVPTGRISFFAFVPGSKLPGYDHLVPPGQHTSEPLRLLRASRFFQQGVMLPPVTAML
jgi:hypothetical protein